MVINSQTLDIAKVLGEVLSARILEMAHKGDIDQLARLGINQAGFTALTDNLVPTDVSAAVAQSLSFSIDEQELLSKLNLIRSQSKRINVLNDLIRLGASFEMCRHFYNTHTNRKHTQIRMFFDVNSVIEIKNDNRCDQTVFDEYLYAIEQKRRIKSIDLLSFAQTNQLNIGNVWQCYKDYLACVNNFIEDGRQKK